MSDINVGNIKLGLNLGHVTLQANTGTEIILFFDLFK